MDRGAWWATVHGVIEGRTRWVTKHRQGKDGELNKRFKGTGSWRISKHENVLNFLVMGGNAKCWQPSSLSHSCFWRKFEGPSNVLMIVGEIGTHFSLVRMTISAIMLLVLGKDVYVHVLPGSVSTSWYIVLRHCFSYVFLQTRGGKYIDTIWDRGRIKIFEIECGLFSTVFCFFFFFFMFF